MNKINSICVYCGSSVGENPAYAKAAQTLGKMMAQHHIRLVYGGGNKGIMGAISRSVKEAGGKVTGIIPTFLMGKEANGDSAYELDELIITDSMHQRKHLMFEHSDAFVTLPGGIGTLEEIVEMMTWAQLGHHRKPMVFANIAGFWNPLSTLLSHMKQEGFIHNNSKMQPLVIDDAEKIIPAILDAAQKHDSSQDHIDKM